MLKLQKQGFGKATGNSRMMILPAKMSVWIKYVEIELLGRFQSFLYVRCCPSFSRNRGKRTIDCHIKLCTYSRQDGVLTQAASSRWGIETSKLAVLSNKNRFQPAHCRFSYSQMLVFMGLCMRVKACNKQQSVYKLWMNLVLCFFVVPLKIPFNWTWIYCTTSMLSVGVFSENPIENSAKVPPSPSLQAQ